ncbi:hypothetical protein [Nocardia macrotermitis]|uniref:Uncharacterized protein n=1 Tax=Nocardia macrotermitis TaxID=2585198 RepID=A0A7K0DAV5_9NOCA|nr:hypothetical protein [Nocardia macrotermitis]MQY22910.1 hypothetical protein [Nocardia macrotermitis]
MALGQGAAAQLWQEVNAGTFTLTVEAAHEVAGHYQWIADEMRQRGTEVAYLQRLDGFGGFDSAKHLQSGFETKAVQAFDAFKSAQESALRMKAAVLQAAKLTQEVDAANAAATRAASRKISDA